jgi:hypothetical protein
VGNDDFSVAANPFYSGKINKEGIDGIEKNINQMSLDQCLHFIGPIRIVSLKEVCGLIPYRLDNANFTLSVL